MKRYICIHGHFYQPPRENPWLETIELQDSAYPYHDWNARITAESYGPNAASRILDRQGYILRIVNNYIRISHNFGPTLMSWLEVNAPDVYRAILKADEESRKLFSGHGSAIAQVYNHIILPLANARDKRTQVVWGKQDFLRRYGRAPEGMWLAETAVDIASLEALAAQGIKFTLLSPYQARRVRKIGTTRWSDVSGGKIDPTRAYLRKLPSGREIALFFYDGPISQAVAFEKLLNNGEQFANRLGGAFSASRDWPQLVHIATDGETYGHHHYKGDMALAYALHHIESTQMAEFTNFGAFLAQHPPTHEVEILENTAWSCSHGLGRWKEHCGCNSGSAGWNQRWRGPLREAFDWLRDTLARHFERLGHRLFRDPWQARDDYISVVLDRSKDSVETFLEEHATRALEDGERTTALELLEMQRHAMLMYTSCGWFFDELSGIETTQVIQYAGRAVQLGSKLSGKLDLETQFMTRLRAAKSNLPEYRDGENIYTLKVKPSMVDLPKVGAHYALSSLFDGYPEESRIYAFGVQRRCCETYRAGNTRVVVGEAEIRSELTRESGHFTYGALCFGEHNLLGGVRVFRGAPSFRELTEAVRTATDRADIAGIIQLLTREFGDPVYSMRTLFRDEQRRILQKILEATLAEDEGVYRRLYNRHISLMRFIHDIGSPLPLPLYTAARFTLNVDIMRAIEQDPPDLEQAGALLKQAKSWNVALDTAGLAYGIETTIARQLRRFREDPISLEPLERLCGTLTLTRALPFEVNLGKVQITFCNLMETLFRDNLPKEFPRGVDTKAWAEKCTELGRLLEVRVNEHVRGILSRTT